MITPKRCKVENCDSLGEYRKSLKRSYLLQGMCRSHYRRWKSYGDPLGGKNFDGTAEKYFFKTYKTTTDDCIVWPFNKYHTGHGNFNYRGKCTRVHRLAMELLVGRQPKDKPEVMHLCNVPACYNIKHLKYGTHAENMAYMSESGRSPIGERCGTSKLKERHIIPILEDRRANTYIASDYGVSSGAIWKIKHGRSWVHIYRRWHQQQVARAEEHKDI